MRRKFSKIIFVVLVMALVCVLPSAISAAVYETIPENYEGFAFTFAPVPGVDGLMSVTVRIHGKGPGAASPVAGSTFAFALSVDTDKVAFATPTGAIVNAVGGNPNDTLKPLATGKINPANPTALNNNQAYGWLVSENRFIQGRAGTIDSDITGVKAVYSVNQSDGISRLYIPNNVSGLFVRPSYLPPTVNARYLVPDQEGVDICVFYLKSLTGNVYDVNDSTVYLYESVGNDLPNGAGIYATDTIVNHNVIFINSSVRIYVDQGANGTITPNTADGYVAVPYRGSQSFNIAADAGYEIAYLIVNGSSITLDPGTTSYTYDFTDVYSNQTISAEFQPIGGDNTPSDWYIIATADGAGTISPVGNVGVNDGDTDVTFTLTPDSVRYELNYILVDGVQITAANLASPDTYTFAGPIHENHIITAYFKNKHDDNPPTPPTYYSIEAKSTSGGVITPVGLSYYVEGSTPLFTTTSTSTTYYKGTDLTTTTEIFYNFIELSGNINGSPTVITTALQADGTYSYTFPALSANSTINLVYQLKVPTADVPELPIPGTSDLTGTGLPGATLYISVTSPAEYIITKTIAIDEHGVWTINLADFNEVTNDPFLPSGTYTFEAYQVDSTGNTSEKITFTIIVINTKTYSLTGSLRYEAGGFNNNPNVTVTLGEVSVYDTTDYADDTTDLNVVNTIDFSALEPVNKFYVEANYDLPYADALGDYFTITGLEEGRTYVVLLHKKNHTNIVLYNISYAPQGYYETFEIGDYKLQVGDLDRYDHTVENIMITRRVGDNAVNTTDYSTLRLRMYERGTGLSLTPDLNDDGMINPTDMSILLYNLYIVDYNVPDEDGIIKAYTDVSSFIGY
jgi:hypothetical protein